MRLLRNLLFIVSYCAAFSCSDNGDGEPEGSGNNTTEKMIIEGNRVSCEDCGAFGQILEASNTQVFVGGDAHVWIFDYNAQGLSMAQELNIEGNGFISSLTVEGSRLLVGIADNDGTGSVHQFNKSGTNWEFGAKYEIARYQDNFGNDVSLYGDIMVVGANAFWDESFEQPNVDAGSIYIYTTGSQGWELTQEFYASQSNADDWFGNDVLVWENVILAGGLTKPLHIYTLENNTWTLASVETDINPVDFGSYDNVVLYLDEMTGFHSFRINPDGSLTDIAVTATLDSNSLNAYYLDNISIYEDTALIAMQGGQVNLLKLENNEWNFSETLGAIQEEPISEVAVKLTAQYAFYAGYPPSGNTSYLYFESY
jgi:hypothetical protein